MDQKVKRIVQQIVNVHLSNVIIIKTFPNLLHLSIIFLMCFKTNPRYHTYICPCAEAGREGGATGGSYLGVLDRRGEKAISRNQIYDFAVRTRSW